MHTTIDEDGTRRVSLCEYLNEIAEHGRGCAVYMHSAAECTCGLADARVGAEDIVAAAWDVCTHWTDHHLAQRVQALHDALECAGEEPPDAADA